MDDNDSASEQAAGGMEMPATRGYQQEMLDESMRRNIIIALNTGSGKTLIAVLRMKHEMEREPTKISWFFAPTVALCQQQLSVITAYLPVSVGIVSGANEPDQWKDAALWARVLNTHRVMVSTPQVFLDALRHGYISLGRDISLLVFDEAHHAVDNHPYNRIMKEFYFALEMQERPMVLGLTASPIYGGNVEKAFRTIEANLDCTIRAPRRTRAELAAYVHPPVFKHIMYLPAVEPFSTNFAALAAIWDTLDIENDPYVVSLRAQLARTTPNSPEHQRADQKLSKVIAKQNSFTHKGLADFLRASSDICQDVGPWAADWFVWRVMDRARKAANPYSQMMVTWKASEKGYLLNVLDKLVVSPVSHFAEDIKADVSDKTRSLIECLLAEKEEAEAAGETYSCIVFVQRRDEVLALAEVLAHHPDTKDVFSVGTLLGTSDSTHRHSLMDITRSLVREVPQDVVLSDFKTGARNLIISTAVAEEGIDIQACGSVIRWDLPQNMASWAQSKGRARKKRSTFTMMFEEGSGMEEVQKWVGLEEQMRAFYNDPSRGEEEEQPQVEDIAEDEDLVLEVGTTGALLTLHSAISHLTHFCAVIPNTSHVDNRPLFEVDPPEFPDGWHFSAGPREQYTGPYGSKVTLPRSLPLPLEDRVFVVPTVYASVISAHRHAAFAAYRALYERGLLNDNLLPMTGMGDVEEEEDVREMLREVEKREGLSRIKAGLDPWAAPDVDAECEGEVWHSAIIDISGLDPLWLCTRSPYLALDSAEGPTLYLPGGKPALVTSVRYQGTFVPDTEVLHARMDQAREWTRALFWGLNRSRMEWDRTDFSYLLLPTDDVLAGAPHAAWTARRAWQTRGVLDGDETHAHRHRLVLPADVFAAQFGYTEDVTMVQRHLGFGRPFKFVAWRWDKLDEEEEAQVRETYKNQFQGQKQGLDEGDQAKGVMEITYPLLLVEAYPPRSNFLIVPKVVDKPDGGPPSPPMRIHLLPQYSSIVLLSPSETEYAFLLPSILRFLSMRMIALSLRRTLFTPVAISEPEPSTASDDSPSLDALVPQPTSEMSAGAGAPSGLFSPSPLCAIPLSLLTTAITAPASGEPQNYQRLETLGDTVLKFICGANLLAEYPLWHEGYLTRKKDHAVSNVRLAKEDVKRGIYRWIVRDVMLGKKWKPQYVSGNNVPPEKEKPATEVVDVVMAAPSVSETENVGPPVVPDSHAMEGVVVMAETENVGPPPARDPNAMDVSAVSETKAPSKKKKKKQKKKAKDTHQLSTKVLADVMESTIGAAYLHGGFDLGSECIKLFDLGVKWAPLSARITQLLKRVDAIPTDTFTVPPLLADVETMLGYTFTRKLLLVEALTHASYQQDARTPSYERMEFLGDSVLDMVVTDMLYHAPGKNYSPGHMHLRKSAVVNGHILSYFCLRMSTTVDAVMPRPAAAGGGGEIEETTEAQVIHLWKCLLHSSPKVLEDQLNAATRFAAWSEDIETSLMSGNAFPWAALTRLQAPKFFSDMVESIIGAVFIDSEGALPVVAEVLRTLGILQVLEHIIQDDVDVLHPVSRLSLWAQKHERAISYETTRAGGKVVCAVIVDGVEEAVEEAQWRGKPSQEEVKYNVAEKAIKIFKLRDVGVGYELLKKKRGKNSGQ